MQGSRIKRLAELEQKFSAAHEREAERLHEEIWEQLSAEEQTAVLASVERRRQPGYVLTAEDNAIEQRWNEAVQAALPEPLYAAYAWREWAVQFGKAVRAHS